MTRPAKRAGAIALAACLFVALAFGGIMAWAAASWQGDGPNTLTVKVDESLGDAAIVVDVYQVATAEASGSDDTYSYTWNAPFGQGAVDLASMTKDSWEQKAFDCAAATRGAQIDSVRVAMDYQTGEIEVASLEDGFYLVLPHGADEDVAFTEDGRVELKAYGETHEYAFKPQIVALPTKDADEDGVISTADPGDWKTEAVIQPKFDKFPLFGKLRITKTVEGFAGEMATFVFHITGTTPDGGMYDNYASITCSDGNVTEAVVTHIPAGAKVTVTEEPYEGMRYTLKDGDTSEKTIVADRYTDVDAGLIPVAEFVNEPGPSTVGGHGVQNSFELISKGADASAWDWAWQEAETSPSGALTDRPSS